MTLVHPMYPRNSAHRRPPPRDRVNQLLRGLIEGQLHQVTLVHCTYN